MSIEYDQYKTSADLGYNFQPNALDKVSLTTYHIKFYMLPPGRANTFEALDPDRGGAIIAESGVTGQLTIDNLYSRAYTSFSENRGSTEKTVMESQKITFNIKELMGISLFDKIRYTATQIGSEMFDVKTGIYYMEVSFRANGNPNGSDPTGPLPFVYRWPFGIQNIDAHVTGGGTSYDVVGYHKANSDNSNINGATAGVLSVTTGGTYAINNGLGTATGNATRKQPNKYKSSPSAVGSNQEMYAARPVPTGQSSYSARLASAEERSRSAVSAMASASSSSLVSVAAASTRNFSRSLGNKLSGDNNFRITSYKSDADINGERLRDALEAAEPLSPEQYAFDAEYREALANGTATAGPEQTEPSEATPPEEIVAEETDNATNYLDEELTEEDLFGPDLPPQNKYGDANTLKEPTSFGLPTVGVALKVLAQALTNRSEVDRGGLNKPGIKYVINAPDEIMNMRMSHDPNGDNGRWTSMFKYGPDKKWNMTFTPGTTVDVMINNIIKSSPDYQAYSRRGSVPNGKVDDADQLKTMHKIVITATNASGGTYGDVNDIGIMTYTVQSAKTVAATEQIEYQQSAEIMPAITQQLSSNGMLKKRYFYVFTGRNDQIINLDLKFNLAWYIDAPVNAGQYNGNGTVGVGEVNSNIQDNPSLEPTFKERYALINATPASTPVYTGNAPPITIRRGNDSPPGVVTDAVPAFSSGIDAFVAKETTRKEKEREKVAFNESSAIRFVEDALVGVSNEQLIAAISANTASVGSNSNDGSGVNQVKGIGRPYVNSLFSAAFGAQGELTKIEMKIKGDPYWLGPTMTTGIALPTEVGAPFFVLSVKSPDLYNVDSGLAPPIGGYQDGLYRVICVDNEFIAGAFHQTLFAVIDPRSADLVLPEEKY